MRSKVNKVNNVIHWQIFEITLVIVLLNIIWSIACKNSHFQYLNLETGPKLINIKKTEGSCTIRL